MKFMVFIAILLAPDILAFPGLQKRQAEGSDEEIQMSKLITQSPSHYFPLVSACQQVVQRFP